MYEDLITPYQATEVGGLQLGGILMNNFLLPNAPVILNVKALPCSRHAQLQTSRVAGLASKTWRW